MNREIEEEQAAMATATFCLVHTSHSVHTHCVMCFESHSGKLSREKLMKFEVLSLFAKVFSKKFGSMASFGGTNEQSVKVFPAKIHRFAEVFSHESFPLYDII